MKTKYKKNNNKNKVKALATECLSKRRQTADLWVPQ